MLGLFKKKESESKDDVVNESKPEPKSEPVKTKELESKADAPEKSSSPSKSGGAYFVSPHPDGGWQVKKANAQKALKRFKTKAEAEEYAKQVASNQGTTVVRQKKDGKIQKKR